MRLFSNMFQKNCTYQPICQMFTSCSCICAIVNSFAMQIVVQPDAPIAAIVAVLLQLDIYVVIMADGLTTM
jgi:hypothetical protein